MKKLLIVFSLAGILAVPSVVFAEATWYGSFRGGVESAGGSSHVKSFGSRWGVKGSNEVAEGLVANYAYEEDLDLATATLADGNRLSYVGLSGGFGTLTIGRMWSASFNSVGALLDPSNVYGTGNTSLRVGPAVSYSNTSGAASVQVDLVMDGGNTSKNGIDQYEFGLSFDLGAATLAFAHRKMYVAARAMAASPTLLSIPAIPTAVLIDEEDDNNPIGCPEGTILYDANDDGLPDTGDKCYPAATMVADRRENNEKTGPITNPVGLTTKVECEKSTTEGNPNRVWEPLNGGCYRPGTDFYYTVTAPPGTVFSGSWPAQLVGDGDWPASGVEDVVDGQGTDQQVKFHIIQGSAGTPEVVDTTVPAFAHDTTLNAMAIQVAAGDHTAALGFTIEKRSDDTKSKATIASMSGPVSDGVNYYFQLRSVKANDGTKTNPWALGFNKSLGAGAEMVFEHGNSDSGGSNEGSTALFLKVDF